MDNQLISLALKYKETKLWERINENQVFAVKTADGMRFVCIMGGSGQYIAINMYTHDGFSSFWKMNKFDDVQTDDFFELHERMLCQDCIQLSFASEENVSQYVMESLMKYKAETGVNPTLNGMLPTIEKFRPYYFPWHDLTDEESDSLKTVLKVVSRIAKDESKCADIQEVKTPGAQIPVFELQDGEAVRAGEMELPGEAVEEYEDVIFTNDIMCAKARSMDKNGRFYAQLIRLIEPMQDQPEKAPYFPMIMLVVKDDETMMIPSGISMDYENNPQEIIMGLINACGSLEVCPEEIVCIDERTLKLVSDFADKAGIATSLDEESDGYQIIGNAKSMLLQKMQGGAPTADDDDEDYEEWLGDDEEFDEGDENRFIAEAMLMMDKEELKALPSEYLDMMKAILDEGELPEDITEELRKKLDNL